MPLEVIDPEGMDIGRPQTDQSDDTIQRFDVAQYLLLKTEAHTQYPSLPRVLVLLFASSVQ
jgi:hypothetical protein